ncbi:serine/threonine protein kinase [Couchioplanes caeruleus]|uniref:serine/threonine-protein kinase n=1 Tax=Couchioplanes caeruleus TaxID=56438 RepID=UPI0020C1682A|nr:serine/threonine-protein kinase [Couchioplanes caeruleus]UQU66916.1 serine/threonine protein kinase [Couchioplanes caeruleus]
MDKDPTSSGARADSDGASTLDLSGRCVGSSYILIRPIGQGATGTVWRGVDRASGEPVAVKLLHESLLRQPRLVTRFVQERTILLMLRHRNVVRVRDLFSVGESLGLVMDLVPGGSLRDHLREHHTLPPAEAARLGAQVAAALAEAHELGIVHRDLKPDNILLHLEDGRLDIRLTDFGIARVLTMPSITTTNAVVGTPHYMAPEAFHSSSTSPAADVYALGVLLYEMVSGRPPYDSDTVTELMQLHLVGNPGRRAGVPDALWTVITGCLEQKPRLRPSAAELVAELETVARSTADVPALPAPAVRQEARPRRSRTPDPEPPAPAPPLHPSLASMRKLPVPRRRNQPASWRWARPWAMIGLVCAAMVASGVATTAWHMGHADGEPQAAAPLAGAPTAGPVALTPSAVASAAPAGRKGAGGAAADQLRANAHAAAARAVTTPRARPATKPAKTKAPVVEKTEGPWVCQERIAWDFRNPLVPRPCHQAGKQVQVTARLTSPGDGTGIIAIGLLDVASGGTVGATKTCNRLVFTDGHRTQACGALTVSPPRGRRYQAVMEWRLSSGGRTQTGSARGTEFSF